VLIGLWSFQFYHFGSNFASLYVTYVLYLNIMHTLIATWNDSN